MGNFDPRVDAYIDKAPEYAKAVLTRFRNLIHEAEPDIKEAMKWGHVHFELKSPICYMAAFKQHCRLGFWHSGLLPDPEGWFKGGEEEGRLYKIAGVVDLPADEILIWYMRNAVNNCKQGIKSVKIKVPASAKAPLVVPDDFEDLLHTNTSAKAYFDAFSYAKRKEYLEWFADAKTEATRQKRMNTAVEWLAEGKFRNWKYQ